jgi:hypothetical protein
MRNAVNVFALGCALASFPVAAPAGADGEEPQEGGAQLAGARWVPSLAITGGASFQNQDGFADSLLFEDLNPVPVPLRGTVEGDDLAVAPFVGAALEILAPALPIPSSPRLFVSGEFLPSFAEERTVAVQGDPGCVRGPEPGAPCARDEVPGQRRTSPGMFGEVAANGLGSRVTSEVDLLVYGASLGMAFPLRLGERELRLKPSFGWISYEVEAKGLVVDAACDPAARCTDVYALNWMPGDPPLQTGFLRETTLTGEASRRFNGIGPGLDVEVDVGRFGPFGASLFLGGRAYHALEDTTIAFDASQSFNDVLGNDTATASFEVEVDPWTYRAHVGVRFHWLGR